MIIEGMMCGHCEARVKKCLEALPAVEAAAVSHESGTAIVTLKEAVADDVLKKAVEAAEKMEGVHYMVGNLLSSDTFYSDSDLDINWQKMGVLAVEMEAAALYMNAARTGKHALAICTISDSIVTGEATSSEERQSSFRDMMKLALEIA